MIYIYGRGRRRKFVELTVNDPKKAGCCAVHSVSSLLHHWKQVLFSGVVPLEGCCRRSVILSS